MIKHPYIFVHFQNMLALRGKEFSDKQMAKMLANEQTRNPLYLKIFLEEMCNFGDFFHVDKQIEHLLNAKRYTSSSCLSYVYTVRLIRLISYPGECDLIGWPRKYSVIFSRMHFGTFVRI